MKLTFLTVLLVSAGVMHAESITPGIIEWSGTPNVYSSSTGEGGPGAPIAAITSNAFVIVDNSVGGQCCGGSVNYSAGINFNVALPGDFLLLSIADFDIDASTCSPFSCPSVPSPNLTSDMLNGDFSGVVEILNSNGNVLLTEGLFGSGSTHYGGDCDGGDCFANLSINDPEVGVIDLAAGNYSLEVNYSDSQNSLGQSFGNDLVQVNLTPTPEPPELGILLAGLAFIFQRVRLLQRRRDWYEAHPHNCDDGARNDR